MISPELEAQARSALAEVESAAERAEAAAPGIATAAWLWAINADSTTAARREVARHYRADADRLRSRLVELVASPTATDEDARAFVAACQSAGSGIADYERAAAALTPLGAAADVAHATASDLGLPTTAAGLATAVKVGVVVVALAAGALLLRDLRRTARG